MDWRLFTPAATRRQMIGTALAGLILGLGGVTAGTGLVQASEGRGLFGFLEEIFRGPPPAVEARAVRRAPIRYSSLPDSRRIAATRPVRQTPRSLADLTRRGHRRDRTSPRDMAASASRTLSALGARTVCVRACDGYLFPVGQLHAASDLPVHQAACAAACPNAATSLFTLGAGLGELDRAVSLDGQPYRSLPVANLYRTKRIDRCSCQPDGVAATPLPIEHDLTARPGDVIATTASARVLVASRSGGLDSQDFRQARGLSRRARRDIDRKIDVVRREADSRAQRPARYGADPSVRIRVAEAGTGRVALGGFGAIERGADADPGFAVVRVVVPSPFTR